LTTTPSTKDPFRHLQVTELRQFIAETVASGAAVRRLLVEQYLFLEVRTKTGAASWVFRYTFAGAKSSQGFGKFPGVGLAEAREKARHARELLVKGVSPIEAKRAGLQGAKQRHERTVSFAVAQWLQADTKKLTSPKYAAQKGRRLAEVLDFNDAKHKVRRLGGMPVATVSTENITDSLGVLVSRGTHETARRVLSDLEKAFDWARGKGWRSEANPCSGVGVTIERVAQMGHRAPELVDLGDVVRGIHGVMDTGAGGFDYDTRLALLLLLTGARTSEIRLATWSEVYDLDRVLPRIDVPASRMKKRKAWTIPLSTQAAALVRELRDNASVHGNASPLIFFKYKHTGRGVVCNENAVNNLLRKAGLHDKVVGHGFRKLLSTAAYSLWPYRGNNRERAIEHSLAHVNTQTVEQTYNKADFLPERLLLLQWWADHLDRVAAGAGGNVIEFKQA
jgi:integrase